MTQTESAQPSAAAEAASDPAEALPDDVAA